MNWRAWHGDQTERADHEMITIFTPAYNRAYIIEELYRSLQQQTDKNFEWVVIDDGSTDHTEQLFSRWTEQERGFQIRYYKRIHGGKHRAFNYAVNVARGRAVFDVGSDDLLTKDAVSKVRRALSACENDPSVCGVRFLLSHKDGRMVSGAGGYTECLDVKYTELDKYGLTGDGPIIYRRDILAKFPFPEYEGEYFIPESPVQVSIALAGYKVRCYSDVIYKGDYLADGLTSNGHKLLEQNPKGWLAYICAICHCRPSRVTMYTFSDWLLSTLHGECRQYLRLFPELDGRISERLSEIYYEIAGNTNKWIAENGIQTLAVYGCGRYGKYFITMHRDIHVRLLYGIDSTKENAADLPVKVTGPDEPVEQKAGAVLVTLSRRDGQLMRRLKQEYRLAAFWPDFWPALDEPVSFE